MSTFNEEVAFSKTHEQMMAKNKNVGFFDYILASYGATKGLTGMYANRGDMGVLGDIAAEGLSGSLPRLVSQPVRQAFNPQPALTNARIQSAVRSAVEGYREQHAALMQYDRQNLFRLLRQ